MAFQGLDPVTNIVRLFYRIAKHKTEEKIFWFSCIEYNSERACDLSPECFSIAEESIVFLVGYCYDNEDTIDFEMTSNILMNAMGARWIAEAIDMKYQF